MLRLSDPSWLNHSNNITWRIHIMKTPHYGTFSNLPVTYFVLCPNILLGTFFSKHFQLLFFPQGNRPSFTPLHKTLRDRRCENIFRTEWEQKLHKFDVLLVYHEQHFNVLLLVWCQIQIFEVNCSFTSPWRWRQHGPLKRRYPTTILYGFKTQKTSTLMFTAV
jgi:hypothetical protein